MVTAAWLRGHTNRGVFSSLPPPAVGRWRSSSLALSGSWRKARRGGAAEVGRQLLNYFINFNLIQLITLSAAPQSAGCSLPSDAERHCRRPRTSSPPTPHMVRPEGNGWSRLGESASPPTCFPIRWVEPNGGPRHLRHPPRRLTRDLSVHLEAPPTCPQQVQQTPQLINSLAHPTGTELVGEN